MNVNERKRKLQNNIINAKKESERKKKQIFWLRKQHWQFKVEVWPEG